MGCCGGYSPRRAAFTTPYKLSTDTGKKKRCRFCGGAMIRKVVTLKGVKQVQMTCSVCGRAGPKE